MTTQTKIVFIAMSKHLFYFMPHAVKFVVEKGYTPIGLYGIFDYLLMDSVDKNQVIKANNDLLTISDALWVFGPISQGVLEEIKLMKKLERPIKYFTVINSKDIREIKKEQVAFEDDLYKFKDEL